MKAWLSRCGWLAAGAAGLYALLTLASVVSGGPLDPPGPVGSTMKTLDDIPGSWHRQLATTGGDPCNTERFTCVLNNQAVLDKETGLVWQRDASQPHSAWGGAVEYCVQNAMGGRRGWRLPTADELTSLAIAFSPDPMDMPPPNSPFTGFPLAPGAQRYWTATDSALDNTFAFVVDPSTGFPTTHLKAGSGAFEERVVCVRGGQTSQTP